MVITLFLVGFFLPIIIYCVTLGLRATLKTYMLAMGDEAGNVSNSLYNRLSRGKNSTIGGAIRGVGKNIKRTVKGAKFVVKAAKTTLKVAKATIKLAIKVINALIILLKTVITLIISGGWIVLLIVAVIWVCVMIAAWVAGVCASLTGDAKLELPKTKINSTSATADVDTGEEVDTKNITGTNNEKIAKLALQYALVTGNNRFIYNQDHDVSGTPKHVDCSYFVCGIIQEATGYNYTGKKASKTSLFKKNNGVDYGYTGAIESAMDKNGWCVHKGAVTNEVLDKVAKPGDILYRKEHVAIYYGKYKGKHIKIDASTGKESDFSRYDTLDKAVSGKGDKYGFGIGITGSDGFTKIYRFGK